MTRLKESELNEVSGGKYVNAIYTDSMKSQMDSSLENAEKNMGRSRLFMKLDESEKVTTTNINRETRTIMSC